MSQETVDLERSDVPLEEARAELETILRSPGFERSERLQRFLKFICELTLRGEGQRINEYLIGSEVFQRGPNYSPSEDSIVRRQAHALRQKLQEYYTAEGKEHAVRIELPVGRYVPVFRKAKPRESVERPAAPPPTAAAARPRPGALALAGLAVLALGFWVGWLVRSQPGVPKNPPGGATAEIWREWIQPSSTAVVCFSNPMTAVIKHFEELLPPDAQPKRFRVNSEEEKIFRGTFKLPPGGHLYYTPVINQTKMGEAIAAVYLTGMLARAGAQVRSTQSRFLSWEDLRNDNFILLGHNEANHWLDPLLKDRPFRLASTSGTRQRGIINAKPAPGEPSDYTITFARDEADADQEYALISMLPGIEPERRLLLINGLNTQATQIATEFMTSEATLGQLLERLKAASPNHSGPWYFQAVVKTQVYDKVPTKATLVALRAL